MESPKAIGEFERHLTERWKLGPVVRGRERTRLIQGMGRCTRNATDFAVVFWVGQSLVDAATSSHLLSEMPTELRAEIEWGREQSRLAEKEPGRLVFMVRGLLTDKEYRESAGESLAVPEALHRTIGADVYDQAATSEVLWSRAMWEGASDRAYRVARECADQLCLPEAAGYRAWWWLLAANAARASSNRDGERDALMRAYQTGVNSGWIEWRLRRAAVDKISGVAPCVAGNCEALWERLNMLGWAGLRFSKHCEKLIAHLESTAHAQFHLGLEELGRIVGFETERPDSPGAPDVLWRISEGRVIAFEAKSEKDLSSALNKEEVLQSAGHVSWVVSKEHGEITREYVYPVIVSPSPRVHEAAVPHIQGVAHWRLDHCRAFAREAVSRLRGIRVDFAGREFADCSMELDARLKAEGLDAESVQRLCVADCLTTE